MIVLPDGEDFEAYCKRAGRGLWRGLLCDRCRSPRLHGHGSYERKAFVTSEGVRPLPIFRVLCAECGRAPSVVPAFAASGLLAEDRVVEDATARYLADPDATYRAVAAICRVAHATVHRWLGRLGGVVIATILAMLLRLRPELDPLAMIPKDVPALDRKARSQGRAELLRTALAALVAGRRCAEELVRGAFGPRPSTVGWLLRGLPT
jgi:hypothetical protein